VSKTFTHSPVKLYSTLYN